MLRLSTLALSLSSTLGGEPSHHRMLTTVEMPEGATVCETAQQCRQKFRGMNTGGGFSVGDFPSKGCFSKNGNGYFGTGGSEEDVSEATLPGIQERIWCDPTAAPSSRPTANPTLSPVTSSPSKSPSKQPTMDPSASPSFSPSKKPTSKPTASPVTDKPTSSPTGKPVTTSQSKSPTANPVTKSPTVKPATSSPSAKPVTKSPTIPVFLAEIGTSSPTTKAGKEPAGTDSPSKKPIQSPVTDSPTKNPVTTSPSKKPIAVVVTKSPSKSPVARPPMIEEDATDSPSPKPTSSPVTTSPSTQPTQKQVTNNPSKMPSAQPIVTASPTRLPSRSPSLKPVTLLELATDKPSPKPTSSPSAQPIVTASPTMRPTSSPSLNPVTAEPSNGPSTSPSTSEPSNGPSASPSQSPSAKPVTSSPTTPPTMAPVTNEPTVSPTAKETTLEPTSDSLSTLTDAPTVDSLAAAPSSGVDWIAPLPDDFAPVSTARPTSSPVSTTETSGRDGNPGSWTSRSMTPFALTLETQTDSVDKAELNAILSEHLRNEISLLYNGVTQVRLDIEDQQRRLQDGLAFSSDPRDGTASTQHDFVVSGQAYFASDPTPSTAELDSVVQQSLGDEFITVLQKAEDGGLQSTSSVAAAIIEEDVEMSENYLGTVVEGEGEDPIVGQPLYVLGIVFGIGCLLVALYVFKTHRGRKIARENEEDMLAAMEADEESAEEVATLPKYIEVENENESNESGNEENVMINNEPDYDQSCTFYGAIRDAMTSEPSTLTSVGVEEKVRRMGGNPNTRDNSKESRSGTDETPTTVEFRTRDVGRSRRSSTQSSAQMSSASNSRDRQSGKASLESISEGTSKNQDQQWGGYCGAFDPVQNDASQRRKNYDSHAACNDLVGCGPVEDGTTAYERSTRTPGTEQVRWGQKPLVDEDLDDSQSLQTSRISNTSGGNKGS